MKPFTFNLLTLSLTHSPLWRQQTNQLHQSIMLGY